MKWFFITQEFDALNRRGAVLWRAEMGTFPIDIAAHEVFDGFVQTFTYFLMVFLEPWLYVEYIIYWYFYRSFICIYKKKSYFRSQQIKNIDLTG